MQLNQHFCLALNRIPAALSIKIGLQQPLNVWVLLGASWYNYSLHYIILLHCVLHQQLAGNVYCILTGNAGNIGNVGGNR